MVVTTKQRDVFNNLLNIDVYIGADRLDQSNCIDYLGVKLNLSRVQRLQNRAARIITGNFDYINVRGIDIVKRLKWMNVIERRDYLVALIVFKCIRGMAPTYISDCITICNDVAIRDTRNSTSTNLVTLPYASLDIFKKEAHSYGMHYLTILEMCHSLLFQNRPLSRRLDRCDRMIQNEGHDSRKLFTLKKALCR